MKSLSLNIPQKASIGSHLPEANLKHTLELVTGKEDNVNTVSRDRLAMYYVRFTESLSEQPVVASEKAAGYQGDRE